ncbi:MAG: Gfo/Idh/MocA family oxidoreductase [Alphaproteobacteria bacterium]
MKIGLIGCGKQAPKHISGLTAGGGIEMVLADQDRALARRLAEEKGVLAADSVEALFADPAIRAIDIATPTPSHAPLIRRAISAGKHFFCEKPLCETLDEARELDRLTREAGLVGMVGYIYRFAPAFEMAHAILNPPAGEASPLGRPVLAWLRIGGRGSHQLWKHRRESGGGAVNEMLVHMLDLAIWLFGPVEAAELLSVDLMRPARRIQGRMENVNAEDFVLARFRMAGGLTVYIQADMVTPAFSQVVEIQGENGSFRGSIQSELPTGLTLIEAAGGYPAGLTNLAAGPANLFLRQMTAFLDAVRAGRTPERCSLADSVRLKEGVAKLGPIGPLPAGTDSETAAAGTESIGGA